MAGRTTLIALAPAVLPVMFLSAVTRPVTERMQHAPRARGVPRAPPVQMEKVEETQLAPSWNAAG
jgi:hypothetical protein